MVVFNATSGICYHHNFFSSILKRQVNVYHHYNYELDFRLSYMLIQLRFEVRRQFSSGTPVFSVNKTDPHNSTQYCY